MAFVPKVLRNNDSKARLLGEPRYHDGVMHQVSPNVLQRVCPRHLHTHNRDMRTMEKCDL